MAQSRQGRYDASDRERDSQGRFVSEDHGSRRYGDDNRYHRGRYEEEDDDDYDYRNRYEDENDDDYDYDYQGQYEDDDDYNHGRSGRGRQGFASMPREEVRRIASMGGRASHGGRSERGDYSRGSRYDDRSSNGRSGSRHSGRQGFASMPREEVRRIAAMGGRSSHGGRSTSRRRSYSNR